MTPKGTAPARSLIQVARGREMILIATCGEWRL